MAKIIYEKVIDYAPFLLWANDIGLKMSEDYEFKIGDNQWDIYIICNDEIAILYKLSIGQPKNSTGL